jgi:hypothetical protein
VNRKHLNTALGKSWSEEVFDAFVDVFREPDDEGEEVHSIYTKEAHSKKRSNDMHTVEIQKVNLGFIVTVGCKTFVFTDEQKMFEAISEYYSNQKAAERKYCEEVSNEP